jgi:hypothetical protein
MCLMGREGIRALRGFLPRINQRGGTPEQVSNAVTEVERLGTTRSVLREAACDLQHREGMDPRFRWGRRSHRISTGHPVLQLALEIAINEEAERRALGRRTDPAGEGVERSGRAGAISDDLLFPRHLRERLLKWEQARSGEQEPSSGSPEGGQGEKISTGRDREWRFPGRWHEGISAPVSGALTEPERPGQTRHRSRPASPPPGSSPPRAHAARHRAGPAHTCTRRGEAADLPQPRP